MSRCFPFSSTGYAGKSSVNDSLIVSIKQQEGTPVSLPDRPIEKAISSDLKKDRKRERKEKKKEKKCKKENSVSAVQTEKQKLNYKFLTVDGFGQETTGKTSLEVLERSNVTEEHGMPVDPQNVSCSSDSTGNSGKRKRDPSPVSSIHGNGNIIRIRLSSQKSDPSVLKGKHSQPTLSQAVVIPKVQEPLRSPLTSTLRQQSVPQCKLLPPSISQMSFVPKVQEPFRAPLSSTSALHSTVQAKLLQPSIDKAPLISKAAEAQIAPMTSTALPPGEVPSTSGRTETKKPEGKKLSHHEKKMLKRETLYDSLFQNLVPANMLSQLVPVEDDDDDWLFSKKGGERPPKKVRESEDLPCSASAALQPCAHYLSDVGVYALPFTIPF